MNVVRASWPRDKRSACVEPVLRMWRAQGREEVARDQV